MFRTFSFSHKRKSSVVSTCDYVGITGEREREGEREEGSREREGENYRRETESEKEGERGRERGGSERGGERNYMRER